MGWLRQKEHKLRYIVTDTDLSTEARTLRESLEALNRQRHKIDADVRRIESSLLAIKWAQHPIGSMVHDDRGDMYQVGGYQSWNLLGYKIKKDGTPGSRMVPIVLKKDKL
jgi:hypothetical protein